MDIIVSSEIPDFEFITYAPDNEHTQNRPPIHMGPH